VKKKLIEEGLETALEQDKGSRIYKRGIDGDVEEKLIAFSCSKPPKDYVKYSLRMLANKMIELQYINSISHVPVEKVKKTNLNRVK
jgi:hypothetical protein